MIKLISILALVLVATVGHTQTACIANPNPNTNPVLPTTQVTCQRIPNVVPVCNDGCTLVNFAVATPVYLQYCKGTICSQAFMFIQLPIVVDPSNPMLGGDPNPSAQGTGIIYMEQAPQVNTVSLNTGSNIPVPVAPAAQTPTISN